MLAKIAAKLQRVGLLKTFAILRKKLARVQRHQVFTAHCTKTREPDWLPGEQVCFSSRERTWDQVVSKQIVSLSADNSDYLEAVSRGEAEGLAVVCEGNVVHYAFLLHRNKMVRLLGFSKEIGLVTNAFTLERYRGRGAHARSVAARIRMAEQSGFDQVISETSYDNAASQRGLVKGGMKPFGSVEFVVLLNVLVIRYKRPDNSIKRIELCW
jgi:hypothetical protein